MRDGIKIRKIYDLLEEYFGDLKWWPAKTAFEVIVGAILTQNTAWTNVEKAVKNLRTAGFLTPAKMARVGNVRLSSLIRPAGYYRIKAGRLKNICRFIMRECGGQLCRLRPQDTGHLRKKLLSVKGVGPETADSILLYALRKPVFVVDAYTKRIFSRHGLTEEDASYEKVQALVHEHFSLDEKLLNQFHALLVETAKNFCKKKAGQCGECPLNRLF